MDNTQGILSDTPSGRTGSALAWHTHGRVRVRAPVGAASLTICSPNLHGAMRGAQGVLPCVRWWVTVSQLDLPFLTPLSAAGCGDCNWELFIGLLQ